MKKLLNFFSVALDSPTSYYWHFILQRKLKKYSKKIEKDSRLIGKGHRGLSKLCSVIGLAQSISDVPFMEDMNFLESIALELSLENMKSVGEVLNVERLWSLFYGWYKVARTFW